MKWQGRQGSGNVDDRRGRKSMAVGGGIGTIIIAVVVLLLGGDPSELLNTFQGGTETEQVQSTPEEDQMAQFVSVVLKDTETIWSELFKKWGSEYRLPTLVLFRDRVQSACGIAGSASAHEIGHHVQNQLGILDKISSQRSELGEKRANQLTVRLELQADFLSGMWAHYAEKTLNTLETGDIEEALNAAAAVGDDNLQMKYQGKIVPDAFTHGTSAQRKEWFRKGWQSGDIEQGDTFKN